MGKEIWKDVVGYEGLYQVSNLGRVRSLDRKIITKDGRVCFYRGVNLNNYNCRGYQYVDICKDGKYKKCKIHRLVAEAFIDNPKLLGFVNHKDEDKSNNTVENLEWCTLSYNNSYGTAQSRSKETIRTKRGVGIDKLSINGQFIKHYECTIDLLNDGYDRRAVYRCCKGITKTHQGHKFKFSNI